MGEVSARAAVAVATVRLEAGPCKGGAFFTIWGSTQDGCGFRGVPGSPFFVAACGVAVAVTPPEPFHARHVSLVLDRDGSWTACVIRRSLSGEASAVGAVYGQVELLPEDRDPVVAEAAFEGTVSDPCVDSGAGYLWVDGEAHSLRDLLSAVGAEEGDTVHVTVRRLRAKEDAGAPAR